jgi:hypothetical protein
VSTIDPIAAYPSPEIAALYRPLVAGAWELTVRPLQICPGYWSGPRLVEDMAALVRGGDLWMSLTPLEFESQGVGVSLAQGHVAILGLGLGWAAAECALNPAVRAVTVVERDPEVVALHAQLGLFARLPNGCGDKIRVVAADAFDWQPESPVDLLLPDIWLPLVSTEDRVAEVHRMQANAGAKAIHFWGQELEIARHAIAAGRALDHAGIAATIAGFGLPLVGLETPDYATRIAAAAKAWMRDRWLPGTENPFP